MVDPRIVQMIAKSVEADGGEDLNFTFSQSSSQGKSRFGSQSPVRYGGESYPPELGLGSFVASTPGAESNR